MPARSAPTSPAPPRYTPRPFIQPSNRSVPETGTPLVSPLAPLPAAVLDRRRKGSFGSEDPHPRDGTVLSRVRAATDSIWIRHRQGEDLAVRPGSLVSPQTLYTGRERCPNETGEPGAINGHASIQLHAAPNNNCPWNLEVPYVLDQQVRDTLTSYGEGVHREDESSSDESDVSDGWRSVPPPLAPIPTYPYVNGLTLQNFTPTYEELTGCGYVTHPAGLLPPFDISPPIVCPGTPQLPWQLLYEPPTLRTFPDPVLEEVPEDDDEEFEAALAAAWMPTSDAQLGRVSLPNVETADALERVPYDARDCNWRTILNAEHLPNAEQMEDAVHDEEGKWSEVEEGEIVERAPPSDPRVRNRDGDAAVPENGSTYSRAAEVAIPVIGTGRHGAVINRDRYSSSTSIAATESTADVSVSGPPPSRLCTVADYLNEAERIIQDVPVLSTCLDSDALFPIEYESDSVPELLDGNSSDPSSSSSGEFSSGSGSFAFVRTADCLEAMARMRRSAPTPDRDLQNRADAVAGLKEWERQQEFAAENTLNLVSQQVGGGKRKVCDDFTLAIGPDSKRMRRLGGDALGRDLAYQTALYADSMCLQPYIAPIINLRGFIASFTAQVNDLALRRHYPLNLDDLDRSPDVAIPFLKWDEHAKLIILQRAFAAQGQMNVAGELGKFLQFRFRDARVLARMLHSDVFKAEDFNVSTDSLESARSDIAVAERMMQSASLSPDLRSNDNTERALQPFVPGVRVHGPLTRSPSIPPWLLRPEPEHVSRSRVSGERTFRHDESSGRTTPFQVYSDRGHFLPPRNIQSSPIPIRFRSQVFD
ncbi:hypothetical protein B0H13DRAFT_2329971 [Mycena leptocephala]|nr:hypothetical protein B0H13DRAFT_2329971 [Mycena leptocephala]